MITALLFFKSPQHYLIYINIYIYNLYFNYCTSISHTCFPVYDFLYRREKQTCSCNAVQWNVYKYIYLHQQPVPGPSHNHFLFLTVPASQTCVINRILHEYNCCLIYLLLWSSVFLFMSLKLLIG